MGARRLDEEGSALLNAAVADADTVARRERKIVRVAGSECWWWTGAISGKGHGRFWFAPDRVIIAHRFGFAQVHGVEALAATEVLGHHCDNPLCQRVHPEHVVASTYVENRREWAIRRALTGSRWVIPGARAVERGSWEGDLVFGKGMSPVAILVERKTRYLMLVALPRGDHRAGAVAHALAEAVTTLPKQLAKSLTWGLGHEMAQHLQFTIATGVQVYVDDPKSPWQRGSNENANGPLRQYLPPPARFPHPTHADFDTIAAGLNSRPRQTLGFKTPSESLADALR